jgi:hypothetical protein
MNVVKGKKREWAKQDKLYTAGRAEIVETSESNQTGKQFIRCHSNEEGMPSYRPSQFTHIFIDRPASFQTRMSNHVSTALEEYCAVLCSMLSRRSEVGDKHRLRCSSYAGCQTDSPEKRLDLFFLACIALL